MNLTGFFSIYLCSFYGLSIDSALTEPVFKNQQNLNSP